MKVLFIGNSYTYYNDMPDLFASLCKENGFEAFVISVTCGGYSLAHYVSDDNEYGRRAKQLLSDYAFDYVVLQEQSVRPAKNPETFFKSAGELMPYIRNNGAAPVFYQTWGRPDNTGILIENNWTHEEMQALLKDSYEKAASLYGAILVHAGDRISGAYRKGLDVFCDDGGHPTPLSSKIIANEFYETLIKDRG